MGFEPSTTAFRSDALTDWAIRQWVQLALRVSLVRLLQFHCLFNVTFHFGYFVCESPHFFLIGGNHMSVAEWADTYEIHLWRILWSSYRKLALTGFESRTSELCSGGLIDWPIRSWVQRTLTPTLYSYSNFIVCSTSYFILDIAFVRRHNLILIEIFWR